MQGRKEDILIPKSGGLAGGTHLLFSAFHLVLVRASHSYNSRNYSAYETLKV